MRTQRGGVSSRDHLSGYRLWLYCLGWMAESDRGPVEEHLLVCEACRDRLDLVEMLATVNVSSPRF